MVIDGPGLYIKYTGWRKFVVAMGLMNFPTTAPPVFSLALSTVVANDVYKLSTSNTFGGLLNNFIFTVAWDKKIGDETLHNGPACVSTSLIHCGGKWCLQNIHEQHIWGDSLPTLSLLLPGIKNWRQINPCPSHYRYILGFYVVLWSSGSVVENSVILWHFHSCFQHHRYTSGFNFCRP